MTILAVIVRHTASPGALVTARVHGTMTVFVVTVVRGTQDTVRGGVRRALTGETHLLMKQLIIIFTVGNIRIRPLSPTLTDP